MKIQMSWPAMAMVAALVLWGCGDNNGDNTQDPSAPSSAKVFGGPTSLTDLRVPDLEFHPGLDPLKVTTAGKNLVTFMSEDSSDVVLGDLYNYFHFSNVGEWDAMFEHFPSHRTEDTAMVRMQREMMDKWFHKGLRNRAGGAHIRYVSPWVKEKDQRVALLGLDLNYFLDFFENFEGNPEGMRLSLQDQYGREAIEWHEFDQIDKGDTALIRQFEVNAEIVMYVLSPLDSLHCTFLPPQISKSPKLAAEMMENESMLTLLRHKRENYDQN